MTLLLCTLLPSFLPAFLPRSSSLKLRPLGGLAGTNSSRHLPAPLSADNIHKATQFGWDFLPFAGGAGGPRLLTDADRLSHPLPAWALRALARAEALDPTREFLPSAEEWGDGVKHGLLNIYPPGDGAGPVGR